MRSAQLLYLHRQNAQLLTPNTFSSNKFCVNILSTSIAIHPQLIENRNYFYINFYHKISVQISGK